tara:strand:- start:1842 stop:2033 length:192 start_codon:yes stop_codon:yes gene_type:complete
MVSETDLQALIDRRVKRVLDYGELAVPNEKFERFRTLVLDEFGHSGIRKDFAELLAHGGQSGK